jgi:flagellar hook-associated protein 3 FlgL
MRITNKVVTEKYLRSINNIQSELNRLNDQVYTGRRFMKVSENTPAAVKAFQIRKDMSRVEGYQSSITHAQGMLSNAESSIGTIQSILIEVRTETIYGLNGSQSVEERQIVATKLKNLQQELLQELNSNAAGLYYFGGNSVESPPFAIGDENLTPPSQALQPGDQYYGKLHYRVKEPGSDQFTWVALDSLHSSPQGSPDPDYEKYKTLMDAGLFVDIGLGIQLGTQPGYAVSGTNYVDRNSVFTYTMSGLEITGVGTQKMEDGKADVSMNLYDLIGALAANFSDSFVNSDGMQAYTYDRGNELLGYLTGWDDATTGVHHDGADRNPQYAITDLGTRQQYLGFAKTRMDTRMLNDKERQQETEGVDTAESIVYYTSQELTYQAALQMGARLIPMSIFNYIQ